MNKYRSAMEKITVTPQMEERILRNLSSKKETSTEIKKNFIKWIRPASAIAVSCVIILGVMLIRPSFINSNQEKQHILIPNPIENTKGVDELKKVVSFEILVPGKLPTGYRIDSTSVISGKLAQIIYSDGSNKITYRAAKGTEDISGDQTSYEESHVVKIGDTKVTLKGNKSMINLATWIKDDCTYSLSFSNGIENEVAVSIISSMKKA